MAPEPVARRPNDPAQAQLQAFEAATGLQFDQLGLLRQAFTHPSYFTESRSREISAGAPTLPGGAPRHNQRLPSPNPTHTPTPTSTSTPTPNPSLYLNPNPNPNPNQASSRTS